MRTWTRSIKGHKMKAKKANYSVSLKMFARAPHYTNKTRSQTRQGYKHWQKPSWAGKNENVTSIPSVRTLYGKCSLVQVSTIASAVEIWRNFLAHPLTRRLQCTLLFLSAFVHTFDEQTPLKFLTCQPVCPWSTPPPPRHTSKQENKHTNRYADGEFVCRSQCLTPYGTLPYQKRWPTQW